MADDEKPLRRPSGVDRKEEQRRWGESATDSPMVTAEVVAKHRQGDEERKLRVAMADFADADCRLKEYTLAALLDGSSG